MRSHGFNASRIALIARLAAVEGKEVGRDATIDRRKGGPEGRVDQPGIKAICHGCCARYCTASVVSSIEAPLFGILDQLTSPQGTDSKPLGRAPVPLREPDTKFLSKVSDTSFP